MVECIHNVSEVVEVFLLEHMGFSGKVVEPPELDLELQGLLTITQFILESTVSNLAIICRRWL